MLIKNNWIKLNSGIWLDINQIEALSSDSIRTKSELVLDVNFEEQTAIRLHLGLYEDE